MTHEDIEYRGAYLILGETEIPDISAIGRRYNLKSNPMLISNTKGADIPISSISNDRKYAVLLTQNKNGIWQFENRGMTGAISLNGFPSEEQELKDGDFLKIGGTIFQFLGGAGVASKIYKALLLATRIDLLTGAYNHAHFASSLEDFVNIANRHGQPLSLIMFDIDHFKKINDTYGHYGGDAVLRYLSGLVNNRIRKGDIFCRTGGEEFGLLLPETPKENALQLAEKLRYDIAKVPVSYKGQEIIVTISVGVGQYIDNEHHLVFGERVDKLMYQSKHTGRNKVSFEFEVSR